MKYFVFIVRLLSAFIILFSPNIIYRQVIDYKAMSFGLLSLYIGKFVGLIDFLIFINSAVTFLYKTKDQY